MSRLLTSRLGDVSVDLASLPAGQMPERQRKSWNFLTWAFFLPQLAASEIFFGTGARAAAEEDTPGHQNIPDASTATGLSDVASHVAASSESAEPLLNGEGYDSQPTGAPMRMDTQEASAALGASSAGKSNTESFGGGGGGGGGGGRSEATSLSFDTSNVAESAASDPALDHTNVAETSVDESVSFARALDHTSTLPLNDVAVSNLQDNVRVPERSDSAAVLTPATDGEDPIDNGQAVSDQLPSDLLPNGGIAVDVPGGGIAVDVPGGGIVVDIPGGGIAVDIPGGGIAVDVKALLGFEISVNADGLTANLSVSPFGDLLGFDAQLSADGVFAGVNVGLAGVGSTAEPLVPEVTSTVESTLHVAGAELSSILALDSHFGSVLLPELLGSDSGPIPQSVKSTLADVTGVHLFGGIGEGHANSLVADLASAGQVVVTQIAEAEPVAGGFLTKTHVLSDLSEISGLTDKGDISSGDVINFPGPSVTLVDELFAGPQYTDYNVTLQAHKSEGTEHETVSSNASTSSDILISIVDIPKSIPATSDPTPDPLLHTSLSVLHLASH